MLRVWTHSLVLDVSMMKDNLQSISCDLLRPPLPTANQRTELASFEKNENTFHSSVRNIKSIKTESKVE